MNILLRTPESYCSNNIIYTFTHMVMWWYLFPCRGYFHIISMCIANAIDTVVLDFQLHNNNI